MNYWVVMPLFWCSMCDCISLYFTVFVLLFFSPREELKDWHRPQVECLAAAGADLLAFETIPSIKEAQAVVELLREFPNSAAWLSFSCKVVKLPYSETN